MSKSTPPLGTILVGDVREQLRRVSDQSIDCAVTSPPYFRLRDYGEGRQIGLEGHIDDWVQAIRTSCAEVARVLVPTGTLWLNLGDTYSTHLRQGAARKSLMLGPERVAFALQRDGWIIRNRVIWAKSNTVPSAVQDRLSTTYEVVYLLARQPRYYFDLNAIRQPHTSTGAKRTPVDSPVWARPEARPSWLGPNSDGNSGLAAMHKAGIVGHPLGKNPGDVWRMSVSRFRGAHFATYPEHLVDRMIRAGCPEARCQTCRLPWRRPVDRVGQVVNVLPLAPTCPCPPLSEAGTVIDPFMGSGTTAVVAESLGRGWIGCELNPDYVAMAWNRINEARDRRARTQSINNKRKEVT